MILSLQIGVLVETTVLILLFILFTSILMRCHGSLVLTDIISQTHSLALIFVVETVEHATVPLIGSLQWSHDNFIAFGVNNLTHQKFISNSILVLLDNVGKQFYLFILFRASHESTNELLLSFLMRSRRRVFFMTKML